MKHGFLTILLNPSNNQEEVMTWFKGQAADFYDSGILKLVPRLDKCLDNAATLLKNKVMYRQFIHSVAFVN
jgi:hypothetical protein